MTLGAYRSKCRTQAALVAMIGFGMCLLLASLARDAPRIGPREDLTVLAFAVGMFAQAIAIGRYADSKGHSGIVFGFVGSLLFLPAVGYLALAREGPWRNRRPPLPGEPETTVKLAGRLDEATRARFMEWVGEVSSFLDSQGRSIRAYTPGELYRGFDDGMAPDVFMTYGERLVRRIPQKSLVAEPLPPELQEFEASDDYQAWFDGLAEFLASKQAPTHAGSFHREARVVAAWRGLSPEEFVRNGYQLRASDLTQLELEQLKGTTGFQL